jgi:hypothetical protein
MFSSISLAQNPRRARRAASFQVFRPQKLSADFTCVWSILGVDRRLNERRTTNETDCLTEYKSEKTEYQHPPVSGAENTYPFYRCEPNSPPRHYFQRASHSVYSDAKTDCHAIEAYRNFRILYRWQKTRPPIQRALRTGIGLRTATGRGHIN